MTPKEDGNEIDSNCAPAFTDFFVEIMIQDRADTAT